MYTGVQVEHRRIVHFMFVGGRYFTQNYIQLQLFEKICTVEC